MPRLANLHFYQTFCVLEYSKPLKTEHLRACTCCEGMEMQELPSMPLLLSASQHQFVPFVVTKTAQNNDIRFKISENVRIPTGNITMLLYSRNYDGKKN